MSNYVNVGAQYATGDKADIPTKAALKRLLGTEPANVMFYTTSGFSEQIMLRGSELADGVKYSVTGPNPYTSRKWYATVTLADGKITVK